VGELIAEEDLSNFVRPEDCVIVGMEYGDIYDPYKGPRKYGPKFMAKHKGGSLSGKV
jgi:hypothetical protein